MQCVLPTSPKCMISCKHCLLIALVVYLDLVKIDIQALMSVVTSQTKNTREKDKGMISTPMTFQAPSLLASRVSLDIDPLPTVVLSSWSCIVR